ncbi:MAG: MFS transporter [Gammaproteobacteria bacterium]
MIHYFWHAAHSKQAPGAPGERAVPGAAIALLAMALVSFMVASDITSLGIILPKIEAQFDAEVSTAQWVVNAYALVFGMLIVAGGRLADLLGRRRMLFIGIAIFGGASIIAGAAPGVFWLIGARALMGVGGALLWPPVISISYSILPKSKAALAGGIILGAAGLGAASGPLIGGSLAEFASWRWVLFVNVPVVVLVVAIVWLKVRIPRLPSGHERIDYAGVATLSISLLALLLALDQAADWGFGDYRIIGLLVLAVLLLAVFVVIERHARDAALIPGNLLRERTLSSALLARILIAGAWFVALVYLPGFMEKVYGYSPLEAGLGMLPMMLGYAVIAFAAGPLYPRVGAKLMGTVGVAAIVIGSALLLPLTPYSGYLALVPGLVLLGIGYGLCATAFNTAGVMAVPAEHASLAGAMLYMCQLVGGSVGLGGATTILTVTAADHVRAAGVAQVLNVSQLHAVARVLAGGETGRALLAQFPHSAGALENLAREAFTIGLRHALVLVIVLGIFSVIVAVLFLGRWRSSAAKKSVSADAGRADANQPTLSE